MKIVYVDDDREFKGMVDAAAAKLQESLAEPVTVVFVGLLTGEVATPLCLDDDGNAISLQSMGKQRQAFPNKTTIDSALAETETLFLLDVHWECDSHYGVALARYLIRGGISANHILLFTRYKDRAYTRIGKGNDMPWCEACDKADYKLDDRKSVERLAKRLEIHVRDRIRDAAAAENRRLMADLTKQGTAVGMSDVWQKIMTIARKAARSAGNVLLLGETGTGKEVIADFIHHSSKQKNGTFVKVNCGALPETLLESELFGHAKGAFTGAIAQRIGRFEQANGGTILLDAIGDMPIALQVKLLRVLRERTIERIGGNQTVAFDGRVIAATHRHLDSAIAAGTFREDLYHRLNIVTLTLPPLRDRGEDIILLAKHFLLSWNQLNSKAHVFAPEALQALTHYRWPGNVAELKNVVERLGVLHDEKRLFQQSEVENILPILSQTRACDSELSPISALDAVSTQKAPTCKWIDCPAVLSDLTGKTNFRDALRQITQKASLGEGKAVLKGVVVAVVAEFEERPGSLTSDRAAVDMLSLVKELKERGAIPSWLDLSKVRDDAWKSLPIRGDNIVKIWKNIGSSRHGRKDGEKCMMDRFADAVS
jgi:DNA-binding NtrC family response regulator